MRNPSLFKASTAKTVMIWINIPGTGDSSRHRGPLLRKSDLGVGRYFLSLVLLGFLFGMASPCFGSETIPLGHKDFYPSPDRPIGFCGDRTAAWPGATPVTAWDSETGSNIVWKVPMPGPSWSQPVVVGDRVYVICDPNWVVCVAINTGKILWQKKADHTTVMEPDKAKQCREDIAFFEGLNLVYTKWRDDVDSLLKDLGPQSWDILHPESKYAVKHWRSLLDPDAKAATNAPAAQSRLADPAIRQRWGELFRIQKEHGFSIKVTDNAALAISGQGGSPHMARKLRLIKDFDVWWFNHWTFLCSDTYATPVSDGRFLYWTTSNDAAVCYDLDGNQRWLNWDHPAGKKNSSEDIAMRFIPSPLLVNGILVNKMNAELKAFDAASGRKLWGAICPNFVEGAKTHHARDVHHGWGGTEAYPMSPSHFRLPLKNGTFLDVVTDNGPAGLIFRLRDGKIVGQGLRLVGSNAAGVLTFGQYRLADVLLERLDAVSEDEVKIEVVWDRKKDFEKKRVGNVAFAIFHQGNIYGPIACEALTGNPLPFGMNGSSWRCPALAGEWIIAGNMSVPGQKTQFVSWKDGRRVQAGVLVDHRNEEDKAFRDRFYYHYTGKGFGAQDGVGNQVTSPTYSGNRIFARSYGYLWCIGDPKIPYDWNPASRPKDVAASLAKQGSSTDPSRTATDVSGKTR